MNSRKPLVLALLLLTSAMLLPNIVPTSLAQGVPTDPTLYHFDMVPQNSSWPFKEPMVGDYFLGLYPHPIQGMLYQLECLVDENDNGEADVCEEIALRDEYGEKLWFHVEYITVTMNVTNGVEWHVMEFNGTRDDVNAKEEFNDLEANATGTQWHEVKPIFCTWWHVNKTLVDGGEYGLSYCDTLMLYPKNETTGEPLAPEEAYHVEWATTNIICSLEEWTSTPVVASQFNGATTTGTYFEILPKRDIQKYQCEDFDIQINITNAPETYAWSLKLSWNNTVLKIVDVEQGDFIPDGANSYMIQTDLDVAQAQGWVSIAVTYLGTMTVPPSGNGWLCNVTFHVIADGRSWLNLFDTRVVSPDKVSTDVPNNDGFFCSEGAKTCLHDVYVDTIVLNATAVQESEAVNITVTVNNEGRHNQTGIVKIFASLVVYDPLDPDVVVIMEADKIYESAQQTLDMGVAVVVQYIWDTSGIEAEDWIISAQVIKDDGETDNDPHDNILIDGIVRITAQQYDLKVLCPITVPSYVFARDTANITFTVMNQGPNTENFTVAITATNNTSTYSVANVSIVNLGSWQTTTATFSWDTDPTVWARDEYIITVTAEDLGENSWDLWDQSCTANMTIRPVYDRIISSVATMTPEIWTGTEKGYIRITVRNGGTENDQFNITLYADHLAAKINGSTQITTPVLAPGTIWVTVLEWDTQGTWVTPLPGEDTYLPTYKLITYYKCEPAAPPQPTQYVIKSEVTAGSYGLIAFADIHPEERPENREDNREEGLPILVKAIPGDLNLDGSVTSADLVIIGKLIGQTKPCP